MSRYTVKGSDALDDKIEADLDLITKAVRPHADAGILLGGYGRGEGTPFILPDGTQTPFNDYDLVVIVGTVNSAVKMHFKSLEKQLAEKVGLPVDLCPYARAELPTREFSLLNYEMKYGHIVLWGDENILQNLPAYPHGKIPLSEGSRLLLNRGKLLLDIKQRLAAPEPLTETARLQFIKFIHKIRLAFGDCALLAAGKYDIAYSVKKERISTIGECPDREAVIEGFRKAVALKEWGDFSTLRDFNITAEFKLTAEMFRRFFPWYRQQYRSNECGLLKAAALNLKWNGRPLFRHPRLYLYDAILELLSENPDPRKLTNTLFSEADPAERFYLLQQRFS